MSVSEEEMKKKILAQQAEEAEERKKQQDVLDQEEQDKRLKKSSGGMNIAPKNVGEGDREKIEADYRKEYQREPEENGALRFASQAEAIEFFRKQATITPPREFEYVQIDKTGKMLDFQVYSCGSGQLFKGSLKEIQGQIKEALAKDPENAKLKSAEKHIENRINVQKTNEMRTNLQDLSQKTEPQPPQAEKAQEKSNTMK